MKNRKIRPISLLYIELTVDHNVSKFNDTQAKNLAKLHTLKQQQFLKKNWKTIKEVRSGKIGQANIGAKVLYQVKFRVAHVDLSGYNQFYIHVKKYQLREHNIIILVLHTEWQNNLYKANLRYGVCKPYRSL